MKKFFRISSIFFSTLNKEFFKFFYQLSALTIISVLLELLFLLLLSILINKFTGNESNSYNEILDDFKMRLIIYENILLISSGFLLVKFFISYRLIVYQNLSVSRLSESLTASFFKNIFISSHKYLSSKNVSEHIKNLNVEIAQYAICFQSYMSILSDTVISISVFLLIFIVNPIESIIAFVSLTLISLIYLLIVKNKILIYGNQRTEVDEKVFNLYEDSMNSIVEIKTYKFLDFFVNKLNLLLHKRKIYTAWQQTISQIPKLLFELVVIVVFISILFYYDYNKINNKDIISSLVIFLFGSLKIIPSINRLTNSIQQVIYYKDSINLISKQLVVTNHQTKKVINNFEEIKLNNIEFSYENKKIIDSLNFSISKNDFVGFFGESGSGKSTILKILLGILDVDKGNILIDNIDVTNNYSFNSVGYVSQQTYLFEGSLKDNICLSSEFDKKKFITVQKLSGLNQKDFHCDRVIKEGGKNLSGGQKQRIAISRALYHNPQLLILDEPTSALDDNNKAQILRTLSSLKNKITIVIVTHDPKELNYCNKTVKINDNKN